MSDSPELLTVQQLADKLQLVPQTVYKLAREGKIPSIRFGKNVRFDLAAVLSACDGLSGKVDNKC